MKTRKLLFGVLLITLLVPLIYNVIAPYQLEEYYNTGDDTFGNAYDDDWRAQTFNVSTDDFALTRVKLLLYYTGTPANDLNVSIQGVDGSNKPNGTFLTSELIGYSDMTTNAAGEWESLNFSTPVNLLNNTMYAIVLKMVGGTINNDYRWRLDWVASYPRGGYWYSNDAGSTWSDGGGGQDYMFETYSGGGNTAPNVPTLNEPTHNSVVYVQNVTLSVLYSDTEGDTGTVWFYNNATGDLIDTASSVSNNTNAVVYWGFLNFSSTYTWHVIANDGTVNSSVSSAWNFTLYDENFIRILGQDFYSAWNTNSSIPFYNNITKYVGMTSGLIVNASAVATPTGETQTDSSVIYVQAADFFSGWTYYPSAGYRVRYDPDPFITNSSKHGLTMGLYTDLPSVSDFDITNKEIGSTVPIETKYRYWVFVQEKYYHFRGNFSNIAGYDEIDYVRIKWNDTINNIQAIYYQTNDTWILESGDQYVFFRGEDARNVSSTTLMVTWDFLLRETIMDEINSTVYAEVVATNEFGQLLSSGWINTNFTFTIYNVGGERTYEYQGSGGHTTGGDTFDLYAGGSYGADIFQDSFDYARDYYELGSDYLIDCAYYGDDATHNKIVADEEIPLYTGYPDTILYTPVRGLHMYRGNTGNAEIISFTHYFEAQSTSVWMNFYSIIPQTDEDIELNIKGSGTGSLAVNIKWNSTGYVEYQAGNTSWYPIEPYSANTWYNLTIYADLLNDNFDYYNDTGLVQADIPFYAAKDSLNRFVFFTGQPNSAPTEFWLDEIRLWTSSSGGAGGYAQGTLLFKNLQHVQGQFALAINPTGQMADIAIQDTNTGFIELGIDYAVNDVWVNNAWKVRLNVTQTNLVGYSIWNDITGSSPSNWIQITASWYKRNTTLVKTDTFYTYWEGLYTGESSSDRFRLWFDLWFNRANASSVVGGRVNSYFYGMYDGSHTWLRWISGENWQIMGKENQKSDFYIDMEDYYGNANVSSVQVSLVRLRVKVYRTTQYDYKWVLQDWDTLNFDQAEGKMKGIDTPAFNPPLVPALPLGGLFNYIVAAFQRVGNLLINALTWGLLELWDLFVNFLDSIGSYFGYPRLFTTFLAWIGEIMSMVLSAFGYMVSLLTDFFSLLAVSFGNFVRVVGYFFSTLSSYVSVFTDMLGDTYTSGVHFWNDFNGWGWVQLGMVMLPVYWFFLWATKGFEPVMNQWEFIINLFSFLAHLFISLAQFVVSLISTIIESIPVVE